MIILSQFINVIISLELDIVKEKLSYELSRQGDRKLDVKNSKEYQTLLKDLKLLLSHRLVDYFFFILILFTKVVGCV